MLWKFAKILFSFELSVQLLMYFVYLFFLVKISFLY